MDKLEALRVLVTVADSGGLASAAKRLGVSAPTVTRAVAQIEAELGVRLFHRSTRVVRLTEEGRGFVVDCRRILGVVEEAEAAVVGAAVDPRGELTITAPRAFGHKYVAPLVFELLRSFPALTARLVFVDRIVDLVDEGVDVAVRIGHLPESSLTAVAVGQVRQLVCAAPRYLAEHGVPKRLRDLRTHNGILLVSDMPLHGWAFPDGARARRTLAMPTPRLTVSSVELAVTAAVAGVGLARLLSYQCADDVRAGRLRVVLKRFEPAPLPVHIVHPGGRRGTAKVRAFVDHAALALREILR